MVARIEAGFDAKRSEQRFPAIMGHNPSPDRTSIGLHSLEFNLDSILFPGISFRKRDGFSFRLIMSMSTSPSLSKSPTMCLRNPRSRQPLPVPQWSYAQIAKHRARGLVRILAKRSLNFRVNVTCTIHKSGCPSLSRSTIRAPQQIHSYSLGKPRENRVESLRIPPKAASSQSPLQTVCIGSALFLPSSSVPVAAPIAEAAPGSPSSRLFSAAPESGGTPQFDP
jgi:hypothetical protein